MKQTDANIFRNILLDDLEHVIFNTPAYGTETFNPTCRDLEQLKNYKFTKKYILIYQNESMESGCDINEFFKKQATDVLEKILTAHQDKVFMIIDHGIFDHYSLRQHSNCQTWPRKYFAPFLGRTHHGIRDTAVIEKIRKHWFCSVMARNDVFRGKMFDWVIDHGLHEKNKISYLGVSQEGSRSLKTIESQNIVAKHRNLIPFNNFESEGPPDDNQGRIEKAMPLYDCLFNLVIETFSASQNAYHTEKALNAVLYGHIPIVIGGDGSMKKLQDMGIIIPDYIQWSIWDDLPIDQPNYSKLKIMQRQILDFFSKYDLNEISKDWYPYAIRNFRKLLQLDQMCLNEEKEICRWILKSTHNISNKKYQYLYAPN